MSKGDFRKAGHSQEYVECMKHLREAMQILPMLSKGEAEAARSYIVDKMGAGGSSKINEKDLLSEEEKDYISEQYRDKPSDLHVPE